MAAAHGMMSAQDAEDAVAKMFGEAPATGGSRLFDGEGDTVKVAARIRPMNAREIKEDGRQAVKQTGQQDVMCTIEDMDHTFAFDRVFSSHMSQDTIYSEVGAPMIDAVMKGINGAVIAYGQTGSGKTFTMEGGADEDMGIIPRLFKQLFRRLHDSHSRFDVRCTCVEIYNERVFDLVTFGKGGVEIWEDEDKGLTLTGATEVPVTSAAAALLVFKQAISNRKTYETNMNAVSSRSHCVFVLTIAKQLPGETATTFCQLYLADLAGSERVAKTGAEGARLNEAKYINKSLLALGLVIGALAEEKAGKHVPYRDSKLTRLLQNSLGGNSRTVLVITLSPSAWNAGESLSTLRFGQLSSRIQNTAVANKVVSEDQLADMIAVAREKRARNEVLLRRCEENVAQLMAMFDELGISETELQMLAGRGMQASQEAVAAAQHARDGSGSAAAAAAAAAASSSSSASPSTPSIAAAVSSASAAATSSGQSWQPSKRPVTASAASSSSSSSSQRPTSIPVARIGDALPQAQPRSKPSPLPQASSSRLTTASASFSSASSSATSRKSTPSGARPKTSAASRGRSQQRRQRSDSSGGSSGGSSRSRSRSRSSKRRTEAFLKRMAAHEQKKQARQMQQADPEVHRAADRARTKKLGVVPSAYDDEDDDDAVDFAVPPPPAQQQQPQPQASSSSAAVGIAASPARRTVSGGVSPAAAAVGPSGLRPPAAARGSSASPAAAGGDVGSSPVVEDVGARLLRQAREREERKARAVAASGRIVYSARSRSRSRSDSQGDEGGPAPLLTTLPRFN